MNNKELEEFLRRYNWVIECYSPFEIRHTDGSFATGLAAEMVIYALEQGW